MLKVRGLSLKEEFYNYFLSFLSLNGLNENRLSEAEFKGLINSCKELYKHNQQK